MQRKPYKLPPDQIKSLHETRRDLVDNLTEIERAESCDIDCQSYKQETIDGIARIDKILEVFGPGFNVKAK